ncbi:MAG: hypothetical protein AAF798_03620 [Bacteroidota bacterium]
MTNSTMKYLFNTIIIFALLLLLPSLAAAQVERSKTIAKNLDGAKRVQVKHRYGPLMITKSPDNQVKFKAVISFKAKDEEDANIVLQHFDMDIEQEGDKLGISTAFDVENWNSQNGKIALRFDDGDKVRNLRNLKIKFELQLPTGVKDLRVRNKYEDINISYDLAADVYIDQYSGRIETQNILGALNIKAKYSKGRLGNFQEGKLDLYDSDLNFGDGQDVSLKSKYSGLQFGALASLRVDSYDDDIKAKNIKGELVIADKYSDYKIGSFEKATLDIYDGDLVLEGGKLLQIKSKYSSFRLTNVETLSFEMSYDDEVQINDVGKFTVAQSKYTNYDFGKVQEGITLTKSYDDNVAINQLTGPMEDIIINGKYTDVSLNIKKGVAYAVDATMKYGKLNLDEDNFDSQYYKEKNGNIEFRGSTKGASADAPVVKIDCYDCTITW